MNSHRQRISDKIKPWINIFLLMTAVCACGVKGDPLPPEQPPELGRGEPSFQRATEGFKLPNLPPQEEELEGGSDDSDRDEEEEEEL